MNFIREQIKLKYDIEPTVLEVFKTGSSIFCNNSKDVDYVVVIVEDVCNKIKIWDSENKIDYFIMSKRYRNQLINFEFDNLDELFILDEYFKGSDTKLDIIKNKDKYLNILRKIVPLYLINPNKTWKNSDNCCHKHLWWAIIGLKMIENNSYELTNEMKEIIQKCHDGTLDKIWETYVLNSIK